MSESDVSEKRGAALPGSQCPQHAASLTPCHLSPCHRHRPGSELLAVTKAIIHFLMGYTFLPQMPLLFHRTAPTALTSPKSIQGIVGGVVCPVGPSGCHCWCWDGHVHGNVAGAWLHHAASELDGSVCLDHFAKCNNLANRSWPLPDPVVPPTFGSPWALAPSGKAHRRGKRFGLWCLSRRPSIWACTKRSSNWRLYAFSHAWTLRTLTLSTILLTRNPCVWICLRGAYAKSLDEIFMHKDAAGPYARGFFDCSNTQRAADSDEEDKEDEDAQPASKTRCCRLLFAALSRFQLQEWFLFGRHCGQMNGQKETVGPYACLTHSLRKSLTIDWGNWGSTQTSQTEDASDGWFFEQVMLQKCQCFQCDNSPGLFWTI